MAGIMVPLSVRARTALMAFRIANTREHPYSTHTAPVKRKPYREWIASLPSVISCQRGCQAAHISFARPEWGHFGRGKSQKASDRWTVPLTPDEHRLQHAGNEREFWKLRGVNPHLVCLILFGLWSDYGDDAHEHATKLIMAGIGRTQEKAR